MTNRFLIVIIAIIATSAKAFSPHFQQQTSTTTISGSTNVKKNAALVHHTAKTLSKVWNLKQKQEKFHGLHMSEEPKEETSAAGDGTVYDDEVEEYKVNLNENMRAKLMREASTGLDPDAKQTNVILYISLAVVALVALGGQGIFF